MKFQKLSGATPIEDLSGLIPKHISTREELNELEFSNVTAAIQKHFLGNISAKKAPFTLDWLLRIHKDMFGKVWKWAGKIRTTSLNIGAPPSQILIQLKQLLDDLNYWETSQMEVDEIAARIHHRLVQIHPFLNGNGRWARLITNIYLKKQLHRTLQWPEETLQEDSPFRKKYIAALKKADDGNYQALQKIHRDYSK